MPDGARFCMDCGASLTGDTPKKLRRRKRPNGSGTIRVLPNRQKKYAAYLPAEMGGKFIGSFERMQDAEAALNLEVATRPASKRLEWTVSDFYDYYIGSSAFAKKAVKTQKSARSAWRYLSVVADAKMRDTKTAEWQKCIDVAVAEGKSISTARNIKDLISALCREAMKDDVIGKNYSALLDLDGKAPQKRDIFTFGEIATLKAHDNDRRVKFILMLIYTGCRVSELLNITVDDVYDTYMIGGNKTDAGKRRIIPILPDIKPYVDYFRSTGGDCHWLIHRDGAHVTDNYARNFWFYPALVELGILTPEEIAVGGHPRITQHFARHTLATLANEAKVDKSVIARILGHTDFKTTDAHYVDMQARQIYAESLKISEYIAENVTNA